MIELKEVEMKKILTMVEEMSQIFMKVCPIGEKTHAENFIYLKWKVEEQFLEILNRDDARKTEAMRGYWEKRSITPFIAFKCEICGETFRLVSRGVGDYGDTVRLGYCDRHKGEGFKTPVETEIKKPPDK